MSNTIATTGPYNNDVCNRIADLDAKIASIFNNISVNSYPPIVDIRKCFVKYDILQESSGDVLSNQEDTNSYANIMWHQMQWHRTARSEYCRLKFFIICRKDQFNKNTKNAITIIGSNIIAQNLYTDVVIRCIN